VQPLPLLYELSHAQKSGACFVDFAAPGGGCARVELLRGWVHAVDLKPVAAALLSVPGAPARLPPRGEDALALLCQQKEMRWRFVAEAPRLSPGACSPFHPAVILRQLAEAMPGEAGEWRTRAGKGTVTLAMAPAPSCLGEDEKPLVSFLARPRTVAEIERARLCPPPRTARLLSFLHVVRALRFGDAAVSDSTELVTHARAQAYALLELPDGASHDEVKRAYHRLARALHPDLHPEASPLERDERARRFAAVTIAYRSLLS
jgi:hypothetical protein